jgi:hypothetical protein
MVSKEMNNSTHRLHLHYKLGYEGLATTMETEMQTVQKDLIYTIKHLPEIMFLQVAIYGRLHCMKRKPLTSTILSVQGLSCTAV